MNTNSVPKITVITVCFNARVDLEDTIKNIESIAYPNLEYIVIDGGSNDGTVELLSNYSHVVDKWVSEPDDGIYDAMNKGWKLADLNSFIIYLGSGDKLLNIPDCQRSPDVVYYGNVIVGNNTTFKSKADFRLMLGNTLHHQALLIHKSINDQPPFNLRYKTYSDYDFNLRLYLRDVKFKFEMDLLGYAKPDGVSSTLNINEMSSVVKNNCGTFIATMSYLYLFIQSFKIRFMR